MLKNTTIWLEFFLLMLIEYSDQLPESKEKVDGVLYLVIKLPTGSLNAVQLIDNSD